MSDRPNSAFVIRGPVLAAFADADTVRARAIAEAHAIRAKAEQDAELIRRNALIEGNNRMAALLARADALAAEYCRSREAELVELAFGIAYRLVTDMPRDTRTAAIVRTALAEHADWSRLRLRVHPLVAHGLRALLANSGIDVAEDESLAPDDCALLHPDGRTDLGPVQQLRALMDHSS